MGSLTFNSSQVALIRRTVAKDCNPNEFDLFVEMCKARGLNPLLRHCYAFVFNKGDDKRRQMVIVISIDGQRAIAESTGSYRPDENAPRFANGAEKDPISNPLGLTSAEVTVYKHAHGCWFPVTAVAYWDESAPLIEGGKDGFEWVETGETWTDSGKPKMKKQPRGAVVMQLDPDKPNWRKMPRTMLAKCAEMAALRKAFPDDFSGLYGEGEMDRTEVLDLSPSEAADDADRQDRFARIGGKYALTIDWIDGGELQRVSTGEFADKCMSFLKANAEEPMTIRAFQDRNRHAFREFWALHPGDALAIKKEIERMTSLFTARRCAA